jgi:hypothetical protein
MPEKSARPFGRAFLFVGYLFESSARERKVPA